MLVGDDPQNFKVPCGISTEVAVPVRKEHRVVGLDSLLNEVLKHRGEVCSTAALQGGQRLKRVNPPRLIHTGITVKEVDLGIELAANVLKLTDSLLQVLRTHAARSVNRKSDLGLVGADVAGEDIAGPKEPPVGNRPSNVPARLATATETQLLTQGLQPVDLRLEVADDHPLHPGRHGTLALSTSIRLADGRPDIVLHLLVILLLALATLLLGERNATVADNNNVAIPRLVTVTLALATTLARQVHDVDLGTLGKPAVLLKLLVDALGSHALVLHIKKRVLDEILVTIKLELEHEVDGIVGSVVPTKGITLAHAAVMLKDEVADFVSDEEQELLLSQSLIEPDVEGDVATLVDASGRAEPTIGRSNAERTTLRHDTPEGELAGKGEHHNGQVPAELV